MSRKGRELRKEGLRNDVIDLAAQVGTPGGKEVSIHNLEGRRPLCPEICKGDGEAGEEDLSRAPV